MLVFRFLARLLRVTSDPSAKIPADADGKLTYDQVTQTRV
jgi:hypothetical protein